LKLEKIQISLLYRLQVTTRFPLPPINVQIYFTSLTHKVEFIWFSIIGMMHIMS